MALTSNSLKIWPLDSPLSNATYFDSMVKLSQLVWPWIKKVLLSLFWTSPEVPKILFAHVFCAQNNFLKWASFLLEKYIFVLRYSRKYLAMEKLFKMTEGMMQTDSFWP